MKSAVFILIIVWAGYRPMGDSLVHSDSECGKQMNNSGYWTEVLVVDGIADAERKVMNYEMYDKQIKSASLYIIDGETKMMNPVKFRRFVENKEFSQ